MSVSKKLVEEMDVLLEKARQLTAAHDALLAAAQATRQEIKDKKPKG